MPFSNLNLEAIIPKSDFSHTQIKGQITALCENLALDVSSFPGVTLIDRKSLLVIKLEMGSGYGYRKVEVAFRMYYLENTTFSEPLVRGYLAQYKPLRSMYFVVKSLLHQHGLDDQGQGGINTFSVILTLVGFLQHRLTIDPRPFAPGPRQSPDDSRLSSLSDPNFLPGSSHPPTGQLLLDFFYFFGYMFDYQNKQLVPSPPGVLGIPSIYDVSSPETEFQNSGAGGNPPRNPEEHSDEVFQKNGGDETGLPTGVYRTPLPSRLPSDGQMGECLETVADAVVWDGFAAREKSGNEAAETHPWTVDQPRDLGREDFRRTGPRIETVFGTDDVVGREKPRCLSANDSAASLGGQNLLGSAKKSEFFNLNLNLFKRAFPT